MYRNDLRFSLQLSLLAQPFIGAALLARWIWDVTAGARVAGIDVAVLSIGPIGWRLWTIQRAQAPLLTQVERVRNRDHDGGSVSGALPD